MITYIYVRQKMRFGVNGLRTIRLRHSVKPMRDSFLFGCFVDRF